ncbi:hypothetical protein [Actinoplanes sp. NPDC049681]|uniref:hypothetical protein n=1 Tax=Actinoplanes sp. NPDC049681 TaxID=3363905 RepID=UPI0037B8C0FE
MTTEDDNGTGLSRRRAMLLAGATAAALAGLEAAVPTPALAAQSGWRWCLQCGSLWRPGLPYNACPAGGAHVARSWNYVLKVESEGGPGQPEWRLCANCQALWWRGNGNTGQCSGAPMGHNEVGWGTISPRYVLETATANTGGTGQANWRYCSNCHVMVYNDTGTNSAGRCAAGGRHYTGGSWNFRIKYV